MLSAAAHRRTARRSSLVALAAAGALLAGGASSATAAEISGSGDDPVYTSVIAADNVVTVTQTGVDTVVLHDTGEQLTIDAATTDCVLLTPGTPLTSDVGCVAPGGTTQSIALNLGAGADETTLTGVTTSVIETGGDGADTLRGSDQPDAQTTMIGNDGSDVADAGDTFIGGPGFEIVDYAARTAAVSATIGADANDGEAGELDNVGAGIDAVFGGSGGDTLSGVGIADNLILDGRGGDDHLVGGSGNDTLLPGAGADDMIGGAGTDGASLSGAADLTAPITVTLDNAANDGGDGEGDNVHSDVEAVLTDAGDDKITGGPGANILLSGDGNDGIDALDGGADTAIDCGVGADILYADTGDPTDNCEAASNKDALAFASRDTGTTSPTQTVTVTNTGVDPLAIGTTSVSGAFVKSGGTCTGAGAIPAGAACTVNVAFSPTAAGAATGTLTIPPSAAGSPAFAVALSGTGTTPATPPGGGGTPPPAGGGTTSAATTPAATTPDTTTPGTTTPGTPTALPAPKSLSAKLSAARDRSRPYRFTIKGKLGLPTGVTKLKGCSGTVTVTFKNGRKTVAAKKAGLKKDCTYAVTTTVGKKGRMKVSVKFAGNSVLAAKTSARLNARAG